jgi:uncharacterized phage protein (TIGR02220 family)
MAENKKSFILYCDQKGLWDKLDDSQAGKLIKHIIAYVNDENPIAPDFITELAFEPIKQQLKRDLKQWAEKRETRSIAGKAGAEARWQKIADDGKRISDIAKMAVNVNANVNDNVNVTKKIMSTNVDGFEVLILEIIRSLKSEFLNTSIRQYKITNKRTRLVVNRKKDFDKLWGKDRDFVKACEFAFRYKAKEWFGTDMFKYFEPETLLSDKFVSYLEKAQQDKGEPYKSEPKAKVEEKVSYRIPPDRS